MPSDLKVVGIALPQPVVGACPTDIAVDVKNDGTDPAAFPLPMAVCVDISATIEDRALAHYSVSIPPESPPIFPGAIRTFKFVGIQFPCATKAWVTATADCSQSVPNNSRTDPKLSVFVPSIGAMPWLWTDLRVGLKDSTGQITWDPGAICGGGTCLVEVQIRNAGCASAAASVTTLELLSASGQSIGSFKQNTVPIAAGVTTTTTFTVVLPTAVTGKSITFRACADSTGAVTPQCDLTHRCADRTLTLASAGAPKISLAVNASIFPGDPLPVSWRFQNFCSDVGKATARITFQGTVLYSSVAIPVGLQDAEKGEDVTIVPTSAVATSFYAIGTRTIGLEIVGTGNDPGPYKATAALTILPEPIPAAWTFTPATPPATAAWKAAYTVAGRLANPAKATMVPSSVVLNEVSTVVPAVSRTAVPPLGAIVPATFGAAAWAGIIQAWSWLIPGAWIVTGPTSGTFTYTVTFSVADVFGNGYPPRTSTAVILVVSVSGVKIGFGIAASVAFDVAFGLLVAAFAALAGVVTAPGAPALFAAAGAAFAIAGGLGLAALDPPVPAFDYDEVAPLTPLELPAGISVGPARPLVPLLALMSRIPAAFDALTRAEARLIAARIDQQGTAIERQAAAYAAARESLIAAARAMPLAAREAAETARAEPLLRPLTNARELHRMLAAWSRRGLPVRLRRAWAASGLRSEQLRQIESALRTPGFVPRALEPAMTELAHAAGLIAAGIEAASQDVIGPAGMPGVPPRERT